MSDIHQRFGVIVQRSRGRQHVEVLASLQNRVHRSLRQDDYVYLEEVKGALTSRMNAIYGTTVTKNIQSFTAT